MVAVTTSSRPAGATETGAWCRRGADASAVSAGSGPGAAGVDGGDTDEDAGDEEDTAGALATADVAGADEPAGAADAGRGSWAPLTPASVVTEMSVAATSAAACVVRVRVTMSTSLLRRSRGLRG